MNEEVEKKHSALAENKESGFANPREKFDAVSIKQLAESIKQNGLMYRLQVWDTEHDGHPVSVVVDGERRRRAIGLLIESGDWPEGRTIPCRLIEAKTLKDAHYAALDGNIHREELTSFEIAKEMSSLKTMGDPQKTIAQKLNKSETWVSRKLKAFESAAPDLKKAWKSGALPDDTVEDIAQLECDNVNKADHEEDCEDCQAAQETEVEAQLKLRAKGQGRHGKTKAKKRSKKKARKLQRAGTKELQALAMYTEKAPKDNRYVKGMNDALRFALGAIEEDDFHSEFKSFRREIDKQLEAAAEAEAEAEAEKAKEWAKNGGKNKGEKHAAA